MALEELSKTRDGRPQLGTARPRLAKALLLLVSLSLGAGAFLTLDRLYTGVIVRKDSANSRNSCIQPDAARTHSLTPNCAGRQRWGLDSYDFFTNSLGFRDEKVRPVPLTDARPRIVLLGDSFTESKTAWRDSYASQIATRFPQYEILNGGVSSYSPSNYLNVIRTLLATHIDFDEVFVFIDLSDTQDEAAYYRDLDDSGAVAGPEHEDWSRSRGLYHRLRTTIERKYLLTNCAVGLLETALVDHGFYHLSRDMAENLFDMERSAWTYRKVSETTPYPNGYAPLGVEGGIAREKAKMTLLWQELAARQIPLNVVVYPWTAQVVHDTADSRQVVIWRDWCSGKCKDFISLFPAFLAEKNRCSPLEAGCWYTKNFVFGDYHYKAAGNALVAQAVAKSLTRLPARKHQAAAIGSTPPQWGQ
jgi:hypothetical protein